MKKQVVDRRTVVVAALVTLLIWILSLGSGAAASPYGANQTIPTYTPTGQAPATGLPTTPQPTRPEATPQPIEPPPAGPGTPSATLPPPATLQPGENTPASTPPPGATEPAMSSPTPEGVTALPSVPAEDTPQPGEPTGAPTAPLAVPMIVEGATPGELPPLPTGSQVGEAAAAGRPAGTATASLLLTAPCMWLSLGLVLMAAGGALLVGQRRRG